MVQSFSKAQISAISLAALCFTQALGAAALDPSGQEDNASQIAELLKSSSRISVPKGLYRLDRLELQGPCALVFEPGACVKASDATEIVLKGEGITLEGLCFDLEGVEEKSAASKGKALITGEGAKSLRFSGLRTRSYGTEPDRQLKKALIGLGKCSDIEVEGCSVAGVGALVSTQFCSRLSVHGNRAEYCHVMTAFNNGSEYLQHHGNWSRKLHTQCVWWGGDSNDNHKWVAQNSAREVSRGLLPGAEGYDKDRAGAFDILVENNYAENGTTLCWGSKGRNIVINGNSARYMADMAYDTEGGENVIIANNLSINSKCAGIGCYFYGERILVSGNQVLVLDDGPKELQGGFLRLHSPGGSGHFGNGEILISGNQFVAENGKLATLSVEAARRVLIKGNSFKNGRVSCLASADSVLVEGCQFDFTLTPELASAFEAKGGQERIFKGNVLRWRGSGEPAVPALAFSGAGGGDSLIIDSNIFDGWPKPFSAACEKGSPLLLSCGNKFTGEPQITGPWRSVVEGNVNFKADGKNGK